MKGVLLLFPIILAFVNSCSGGVFTQYRHHFNWWELTSEDTVHDPSAIKCRTPKCSTRVGDQKYIFTVPSKEAEGRPEPFVTYRNPYGFIHETVTVRKVVDDSITLRGNLTTKDTWFPGYGWTIMYCDRCGRHLGWEYEAVKADLKPERFWAFSLKSVIFKDESSRETFHRSGRSEHFKFDD